MTGRWLAPLLVGLAVALGAYQFALVATPRLLMAAAFERISAGGVNRFSFAPLATDRSRAIVRPSPDLAYASCPFDVSRGALLIDVPPVPARYWSLSVFDAETDVAFVRNNVDSGGGAIRAAVALAGAPVPAGYPRVTVAKPRGIALVRILVEDRRGFGAIDAARRQARCRPAG
jgi:uncharacterized membrane protein